MNRQYPFLPVQRKWKNLDQSQIGFVVEKNIAFVPRLALCTMCGVCEGVCPEDAVSMKMNPTKGIYEPVVDEGKCTYCNLCLDICPGFELDLQRHLAEEEKLRLNASAHFGYFTEILRMRSTNDLLLANGASGGMVTATLAHMLSSNFIDGAIVTKMRADRPLEACGYVATSLDELIPSQKSKYLPNPMGVFLKSILNGQVKQNRLAFVGLPCHIEALRLAQEAFPILKEKIVVALAIFCSRVPTVHATEFLLNNNRIQMEDLIKINYRGFGHPGKLSFELKDGKLVTVNHLDWSYWGYAFIQFFYPTRCFMCYDKTGEQADISFGDNWQGLYKEQLGSSSVIVRNRRAKEVVDRMIAQGDAVVLNPLTAEQFTQDQDLVKKRNLGNRLLLMRLFGRKTPIYYDRFEITWGDIFRTFKLVRHVFMAERDIRFSVLKPYIYISYKKKMLWQFFVDSVARIKQAAISVARPIKNSILRSR
ncbi:MAG: Coenzyme F420 hydrogenase/dehydrogenase, beta subunit C-terminal domain [Anaerolineales bacterium]|nr:Coenzyme F420 hydrogenase/dehydrogenase, beta subunit C-terminal domain [Anaerolineales bacterium]